jgi:hypothetical protein
MFALALSSPPKLGSLTDRGVYGGAQQQLRRTPSTSRSAWGLLVFRRQLKEFRHHQLRSTFKAELTLLMANHLLVSLPRK